MFPTPGPVLSLSVPRYVFSLLLSARMKWNPGYGKIPPIPLPLSQSGILWATMSGGNHFITKILPLYRVLNPIPYKRSLPTPQHLFSSRPLQQSNAADVPFHPPFIIISTGPFSFGLPASIFLLLLHPFVLLCPDLKCSRWGEDHTKTQRVHLPSSPTSNMNSHLSGSRKILQAFLRNSVHIIQ